jgi:small subunit ribosomal protein S8
MDQIANMINMIKNSNQAGQDFILIPYSKVKYAIAECLLQENFIKSVSKKMKNNFSVIEIGLIYIDGQPKINGVDRVSKLSRRVYLKVKDIKLSKGGHGLTILTTPKGVLTSRQARKEMVGGEVLFKVW